MALFTRDILAHNIAIKRFCDKKDNFEPQVSFDQGKLLGTLHLFLSLPWLGIETYGSKIYFYISFILNISFYRNFVCQNVLCE